MSNGFQIVVLAAGQGKRMGNPDQPKVLTPLNGKSMLSYLLSAINASGVSDDTVIVVGKGAEEVKKTFGADYSYVLQAEQLGTGHAVLTAKEALGSAQHIMVLYGDHPLISPELIKNLAAAHLAGKEVLTMATVRVPNFDGWRSEFKSFAKILRNQSGRIVRIVERKDATVEQADITEVNPAYMCFEADWLWENLAKLDTSNAQGEYYLTDLVKMAVDQGHNIQSVEVGEKEALGINTPEQLDKISDLI